MCFAVLLFIARPTKYYICSNIFAKTKALHNLHWGETMRLYITALTKHSTDSKGHASPLTDVVMSGFILWTFYIHVKKKKRPLWVQIEYISRYYII